MNRVERFVYDIVKRNPSIKLKLRDSYQAFFDLFPDFQGKSAYPITVREGHFFGFHDHTPFSADNTKLLTQHFTIGLRMPSPDDWLEIGYFEGDGFNKYCPVTRTRAWNWHQGSKLQWLGDKNALIFNDHEKGRNISRIHDLTSGDITELEVPIATVSPGGEWAVGYGFERVQRYMPGYGYIQKGGDPYLNDPAPSGSGLYRVDIPSGKVQAIISIAELAGRDPEASMNNAFHFVSHAVCSPNGRRVMFMHRWVPKDTRARRERLYSCDADGMNLFRFPTTDMISHIGWRDGEHAFGYGRLPGVGDCYGLFRDKEEGDFQVVGRKDFSSDGHPSFERNGRWFVTDTYADRTRRRYLALFDMARQKRYNIAYLRSPKQYATVNVEKHWTCDLHPRWDRAGRFLCFDSTHTGERALCTIDLEDVVSAGKEPLQI